MQQILVIALAVVMCSRGSSAQCTEAQQIGFVSTLPNGLSCGLAFQVANNTPTGEAGMQALDTICNTSCAGAVAQWLAGPTCNDSASAAGLRFWCQPADGGSIPRCRWALDLAPPTLFNNTDLNSCAALAQNPAVCPPTCTAGLTALANTTGCCYQFIYNNTEALDGLLTRGSISMMARQFLGILSNPMIWQSCNVNIPSECTSATFRDDSVTTTQTTASGNIISFSAVVILLSFLCAFFN